MVYGLWFMVYGLWFMVYGLWFMVYGLWFRVGEGWRNPGCQIGYTEDYTGCHHLVVCLQNNVVKRDNPTLCELGVLGVALQIAFERRTLKPVFHLIGYRLWV
jgi:hypothetical protein